MKVFLSYGHDVYAVLAERLKNDLIKSGYPTWFDRDALRASNTWQNEIENAIVSSDWLIILMTAHSVRRPGGVCLDEVALARNMNKQILPIMIQRVTPPLSIVRLQYMDLESLCCAEGSINEALYEKTLAEVIEILKGLSQISCEGIQQSLISNLDPLDNDVYFNSLKSNFTGREWLFEKFEKWIDNQNSSRLFILLGKPGIGKSAFAANLCTKYGNISGIHFCKYNNSDRANAKRVIMSLAYHLASQLPQYAELLVLLNDLNTLKEKNVQRLFEYLFIEPLSKIEEPKEPIVLIIDALDEADQDGKNALLDVIANDFSKTPQWLRFIVTARPEANIVRRLNRFDPTIVEHFDENDRDILSYIKNRLSSVGMAISDADAVNLSKKCQGSFLYATEVVKDIVSGRLSLDEINSFPQGMTEKFANDFERLFPDVKDYKSEIAPLLEILVAHQSPITLSDMADILDYDEFDLEEIYESICTLFPIENNFVLPLHKSLYDWLVNRDTAGNYAISIVKGHRVLSRYYRRYFEQGLLNNTYAILHLTKHIIYSRDYELAMEIMISKAWQDERRKHVGLDSALREYFSELCKIAEKEPMIAQEIMTGDYFVALLIEHRVFLHNSGLFFQIRDCGFDVVEARIEKAGYNELAVIANYYYITERFGKAMPMLIEAIHELDALSIVSDEARILRANLCNTLGLCYRKYADFEPASHWFEMAADTAKGVSDYEYSAALMNLGKVEYHLLKFDEALESCKLGLQSLKKDYDLATDDDTKKARILFIAEYHRLTAEAIVWDDRLDIALEHLNHASDIYESESSRDRYYIRYKYTSMLNSVFNGDAHIALEQSDELIKNAQSDYDKTQILFYKAFAELCLKKKAECIKSCDSALLLAEKIEIPLEIAEIRVLKSVCVGEDYQIEEAHINNWCHHIRKKINKVSELYDN